MFEQLEQYLKLPQLYETTDFMFWRDDYISRKLLDVHLDPKIDLASRRPEFIESSADWIAQTAPPAQYPRLLDIGCGPGLYAERFAARGYSVTGVDFSENSIAYARVETKKRGSGIDYVCEDYLNMSVSGEFDIAVMIYCDYGALSAQNRALIMKRAFDRLRPGGMFLLDVCSLRQYDAFAEGRTWQAQEGGFWSAKKCYCLQNDLKYPEHTTLNQTLIVTRDRTRLCNVWTHCFSKDELAAEAEGAGFHTIGVYADVAGGAYSDDAMTIAALLQK
jgi:2-polyprenyl-3-methyl-5-hydroxy-6-metoxy-1,4-benzoquinol methylase